MSHKVFVAGVGMIQFNKLGTDEPYDVMGEQTTRQALADSGVNVNDIQQAYSGYVYGDSTCVSDQYYDWTVKNSYLLAQGVGKATRFLQTFIEYPPSQNPASFSVDQICAAVEAKIEERLKNQAKP